MTRGEDRLNQLSSPTVGEQQREEGRIETP